MRTGCKVTSVTGAVTQRGAPIPKNKRSPFVKNTSAIFVLRAAARRAAAYRTFMLWLATPPNTPAVMKFIHAMRLYMSGRWRRAMC